MPSSGANSAQGGGGFRENLRFISVNPVLQERAQREPRRSMGIGHNKTTREPQLGGVDAVLPEELPADINSVSDESPIRVLDRDAEKEIIARIDAAKKAGDTLGGVCEVVCTGLPIGIGSHVSGIGSSMDESVRR